LSAAAAKALSEMFGFDGRGYCSVQQMLAEVHPDMVSICTPPHLHKEHLLAAVAAGCHVMCEKPVAWYEHDPQRDALADARQMLAAAEQAGVVAAVNTQYAAAEQAGVVAAVNTQYAAAVEPYYRLCEMAGLTGKVKPVKRVEMQMDSRGRGGKARREQIWIDLASHPLSVVQAFCGPGEMIASSAQCRIEEKCVQASFLYAGQGQSSPVEARVIVRNVPQGPLVRRLGVNGVLADYQGRADENGQFCAYLTIGDRELKTVDFVQQSLTHFVKAVKSGTEPLVTLSQGVVNLQMQISILQAAYEDGCQ